MPPAPAVLLQHFMEDIADHNLGETALAQKYMCPSLLGRQGERGDKVRLLFRMTVASYREKLRKGQINPQALVIVPYNAPAANPLVLVGDAEQAYEAQYQGETFGRFLIQGGKIAALNLMHKHRGDRGYFLSYCD